MQPESWLLRVLMMGWIPIFCRILLIRMPLTEKKPEKNIEDTSQTLIHAAHSSVQFHYGGHARRQFHNAVMNKVYACHFLIGIQGALS